MTLEAARERVGMEADLLENDAHENRAELASLLRNYERDAPASVLVLPAGVFDVLMANAAFCKLLVVPCLAMRGPLYTWSYIHKCIYMLVCIYIYIYICIYIYTHIIPLP